MTRQAILAIMAILALMSLGAVTAPSGQEQTDLGDAWADMGNWKRAVEHYQKAVASNPLNTDARLRLANGFYRLGDKESSLAEIAALRKAAPRSAAIACAAGVILLDLGRTDEACQDFQNALGIDPNHARSLFGTAQCHRVLFEKTANASEKRLALDALRDYLKRFPDGPHAVSARESIQVLEFGEAGATLSAAKVAFVSGKFRLAETLLRKVIRVRPEIEEAHSLLGMVLASPVINRIDEAELEWKKAPNQKEAWLQRGVLAFGDEELEQASDMLGKAIALDPNYAEAHYQLGLVFREQLKDAEAKAEFEAVVNQVPGTALAEQAASKLQVLSGNVMFLREGEVIDAASEVEIGSKVALQLEQQFGLFQDPELQERLDDILRRITANSDRLPGATPYRIRLVNIDGINALSFTGGTIHFFKGLVDFVRRDLADSDDVYAAIIGHEVSHVAMRHGLGMLDLVGGARQLIEGESLNIRTVDNLMSGISRKHEFEADQLGSLYAYRAGFDPSAAIRFHDKIFAAGKEVPEGQNHPTHAERAARLGEYLLGLRTKARHFDAGVKALDENDYENALIHFEIFLGLFPSSLAGRNNLAVTKHRLALSMEKSARSFKLSTDIDPRSKIKQIRLRQAGWGVSAASRPLIREATEAFRSIMKQDPAYAPARINFGSCLLALGETQEARKVLEQTVREFPGFPEAQNNLAVARLQAQESSRGIEILRDVVSRHPDFPDAYFNLALALQELGQKDEARKMWLSYLARDKKTGWADRARDHLARLK